MLMVLRPEKEDEARAIFEKWDLDFAIVGETIPEDRFLIVHGNETKADLPLSKLSSEAPEYDRPWEEAPAPPELGDLVRVDPIDGLEGADRQPQPRLQGLGMGTV
jgi:phosphoribosylformylglycinamidine synthase subunit PurL